MSPPRNPAPPADDLSLAKRIGLGLAALVLASALGLGLRLVGVGQLTLILVLAVAGIGMVMVSLTAFGRIWIGVLALIVMVTTPFAVAIVIDVPLVGPIVATSVAAAPQSRWAAGYVLADASLRADLAGTLTTERAGRNRAVFHDTYTAAPVVGAGWKTGEPVALWAIAAGSTAPAEWSQPGGLVRLLDDDKQDEVIDRLARRRGLAMVPDRAIGRWVADPAAARAQAWLLLAQILGGAGIAWIVLSLLSGSPQAGPRRVRR